MIEIYLKYGARTFGTQANEEAYTTKLSISGGDPSDPIDLQFLFNPAALSAAGAEPSGDNYARVTSARLRMPLKQAERLANALNAGIAHIKAGGVTSEMTVD